LDLLSLSFSFSLKGELGSLELSSSPDIIFNSILRILVPISFLKRKKMISLVVGKRRKVKWKSCSSLEGMEVSSDSIGRLEL
jgi:hypothetical protein